jgi:hypothetical protein
LLVSELQQCVLDELAQRRVDVEHPARHLVDGLAEFMLS